MSLRSLTWLLVLPPVLTFAAEPGQDPPKLPPAAERKVDFAADIQPIFAERCGHCHGPDEQQGYLRLDAKAIVLRGGQSGPLLEPGKSADSLIVHRIAGLGTEKRMPLEDEPLSDEQIGLVRAWIDQGAAWPDGIGSKATEVNKHWAYVAPRTPQLPVVTNGSWPRSPIDTFVLARLEQEGLAPSPPADRERLIRRVSLDLVGLPPSVAEIDAFLADERPDAYERLIDRLASSPRYGERWATPWLDAARYADSNGYQRDGHRTIWPYRDWVIHSLNADLPFDQFTIEQIAGDLLPEATLEQRLATGFHRCTTVNVEAGTDEEENRTTQVIDRVNVTGTVWLGTTLECCQCHNHKYDPFTQRDYYRFYAFFNSSPKETFQRTKGSAALDFGGPEMEVPEAGETRQRRESVIAKRKELETRLEESLDDPASGLTAWELAMADADKAERAKLPANVRRILAIATEKRNKNQKNQLRTYFVGLHPEAKKMQAEMAELDQQLAALSSPKSLVMTDLAEPRMTAIFKRGNFLDPGEQVQPGTPRMLPALSGGEQPANRLTSRLDLARWLVNAANPLTARVQVNRAWAQFFGRGIVASEEDFGTQAEPATHPELLDWLAVELRDRNWSLKRVHRRIVQSATYQQSSKFRSELMAKDPNNLLLARGPRLRMTAEQVRDNALAAADLLSAKLHGPPVYPPQPEGIWRVTGLVDNTYRPSPGEDAWRRGLYTVRRRSAPYPSFSSFDSPDRSACTVRRARSNTPLQALVLQNDAVYVEAARALADRLVETDLNRQPSQDERLIFAFRTVLSRHPQASELTQLSAIFQQGRERYAADEQAAKQLLGEHALPISVALTEWAAWFNVAHVLLNLDEAITKN
jgi:mono/diheme cytochrome c family protein